MKVRFYSLHLLSLFFVFVGCTTTGYINSRQQSLSVKPQNIVFVQIEGLGVTHLGALRFGVQSDQDIDLLSSFNCTGVVWPQNFYSMRPRAFDSMNAQILGSKSMNGSCKDFDLIPFWKRFNSNKKKVVILEVGSVSQNTLENQKSCSGESFLKDVFLFRTGTKASSKQQYFSFNSLPPERAGVYYDKHCSLKKKGKKCTSTLEDNINFIIRNFFPKGGNTFFLIRDFRYKKLIHDGKIAEAFNHLKTMLSILSSKTYLDQGPRDLLTLVLGSSSIEIEFPNTLRRWDRLLRKSKGKLFKYSGLQSLALSKGASSENFCGSFFDSEVVEKIFFHHDRARSITEAFEGIFTW